MSGRAFGLGLRKPHYASFIDGEVSVDFVEVISANFMVEGGRPLVTLDKVRRHYPVALHGVSMSIGSATGLDPFYLMRLRQLVDRIDPLFLSDHLCWTGVDGFNSHDLLPMPYTEEALATVCSNISRAQEALGRQILVENPSSYVTFDESVMAECDFLREMALRSGCGLLLDVNNVFVSAANHGFDPISYIDALKGLPVRQMHLAGHDDSGPIIIDTHDRQVCDQVWDLYRHAARTFPTAATMIERDDDIPMLDDLLRELDQARAIAGSGHLVLQ